jgi:hypothetical protein
MGHIHSQGEQAKDRFSWLVGKIMNISQLGKRLLTDELVQGVAYRTRPLKNILKHFSRVRFGNSKGFQRA